MIKFCLLTLTILLSACAADAKDIGPSVSGEWANERGSSVTFTEKDGLLSGYYNTQLGNPDPTSRFPLTGFLEGDQITFTVNFKGYGSLTSWTGQISEDADGPYIRIAGSANFRPVKTPP